MKDYIWERKLKRMRITETFRGGNVDLVEWQGLLAVAMQLTLM